MIYIKIKDFDVDLLITHSVWYLLKCSVKEEADSMDVTSKVTVRKVIN